MSAMTASSTAYSMGDPEEREDQLQEEERQDAVHEPQRTLAHDVLAHRLADLLGDVDEAGPTRRGHELVEPALDAAERRDEVEGEDEDDDDPADRVTRFRGPSR